MLTAVRIMPANGIPEMPGPPASARGQTIQAAGGPFFVGVNALWVLRRPLGLPTSSCYHSRLVCRRHSISTGAIYD